jgi:uncharacterized membrane protein YecN with MAPEG domain
MSSLHAVHVKINILYSTLTVSERVQQQMAFSSSCITQICSKLEILSKLLLKMNLQIILLLTLSLNKITIHKMLKINVIRYS